MNLSKQRFSIPKLDSANVMVIIIRMYILIAKCNLHLELLITFSLTFTNNKRSVTIKIILSTLHLFLTNINGFKN